MTTTYNRYRFETESGKVYVGKGEHYYEALKDTDYNEAKDGEIVDFESYNIMEEL